MDDPLGVVSGYDHDLEQSRAGADADYQKAPFVIAGLFDQSNRVAEDMQYIFIKDSMFRVVLASRCGELHSVNDVLT